MNHKTSIAWIIPSRIFTSDGKPTSNRACVRLRCIEPALILNSNYAIKAYCIEEINTWINDPVFYKSDIYIFGKLFIDLSEIIDHLHTLRKKVIIDICDNVFEPPEDGLKSFYEAAIPRADFTVCSSELLLEQILKKYSNNISATCINDCIEEQRQLPRFAPKENLLNILWFGYPNNLLPLLNSIPDLSSLRKTFNVRLVLITDWSEINRSMIMKENYGLDMHLRDWSPIEVKNQLELCDLVIIPSDTSAARFSKSPNRLIRSLWGGRYVVAFPIKSYLEFKNTTSLVNNLSDGITWAINNQKEVFNKITQGQEYISKKYSNKSIASEWSKLIEKVIKV